MAIECHAITLKAAAALAGASMRDMCINRYLQPSTTVLGEMDDDHAAKLLRGLSRHEMLLQEQCTSLETCVEAVSHANSVLASFISRHTGECSDQQPRDL